MNVYVRHGLQAAIALVVVLGLLLLALAGPEPGPDSPQRWMHIAVVWACVLLVVIPYGLVRSYRTGVIWVSGRFRTSSFHRHTEPYSYWFWFAFYILLMPIII